MTKFADAKSWIKSHKEGLINGTVITVMSAGCVALFVWAVKIQSDEIEEYNKQVTDKNNWINEQFSQGRDVYQNAAGTYFSLPVASREDITVM